MPICIVSNIDNCFIEDAFSFCGWQFGNIITSEMCRAYKPNKVVFQKALDKLGLKRHEVLHIGDSISIDFAGANNIEIDFAWVNRSHRKREFGDRSPKFICYDEAPSFCQ